MLVPFSGGRLFTAFSFPSSRCVTFSNPLFLSLLLNCDFLLSSPSLPAGVWLFRPLLVELRLFFFLLLLLLFAPGTCATLSFSGPLPLVKHDSSPPAACAISSFFELLLFINCQAPEALFSLSCSPVQLFRSLQSSSSSSHQARLPSSPPQLCYFPRWNSFSSH